MPNRDIKVSEMSSLLRAKLTKSMPSPFNMVTTRSSKLQRDTMSMHSRCMVTTRSSYLQKVTSDLPDELWLRILGHLSTVDISMTGATCTRLYNLTQDLSLWVKLEFDIATVNAHLETVQGVMSRFTNVREIRFTNSRREGFDSMTVASLIVRARKTLKVLTMSRDIKLENKAVARFGCLVNLEVLDIPFDKIITLDMEPLLVNRIAARGLKVISKLKSPRELRIPIYSVFNTEVGAMVLEILFEELKSLVTVEMMIGLSMVNYGNDGNNLYFDNFKRNNLKTLAENNPNLETVILHYSWLDAVNVHRPNLSDLVGNCPNLKHLNLRGWGGISGDNLNALINAKNLVHLDLGGGYPFEGPQLTDDILVNISENLSKLKYLDLSNCQEIKNSGIRALIQNCPNLEQLHIKGCNSVTMDVIEEIVTGCRKLTKIVTPRLQDVTPKAKKKLRKTHPNLTVM